MTSPRLWIALLAAVSFLAGASGAALVERIGADDGDRGTFADYEDALVERFDLSPERAAHLRIILRDYETKIDQIRATHEVAFYASLAEELLPEGTRYNRLIRDKVLPPSQRELFDEMVQAARPAGS